MTTAIVRPPSLINTLVLWLVLAAPGCSSGEASGNGSETGGNGGSAGATVGGASGSAGTAGTSGGGAVTTGGAGAAGTAGAGQGGASGAATAGASGSGGMGGTSGSGGSAGAASGAGGVAPFELTSAAFAAGKEIPAEYTCVSTNGTIASRPSPPLAWGAGPAGTAGYAIVLRDLDNGFTHWAIWDIPPNVFSLPRDVSQATHTPPVPAGSKQVGGNSESLGYIRPCPPSGSHQYAFTLYAQKSLPLAGVTTSQNAGAIKGELDKAASNVGTTTLQATCTR